jgi:hypothetical protein
MTLSDHVRLFAVPYINIKVHQCLESDPDQCLETDSTAWLAMQRCIGMRARMCGDTPPIEAETVLLEFGA